MLISAHTKEQKIYYTLRLAVAMCFIGHGAFGIITKEIWCNYFAVFGIGREAAYTLMPPVGIFDIVLGVIMLFYPARGIAIWLVLWGLITAALRPLSGEPIAELVERAGNYGAPLVLLMISAADNRSIFGALHPDSADQQKMQRVTWALRIIVFLLIAGHGWLNLIGKKGLLDQYASLGFSTPAQVAWYIGLAELLAAAAVLVRPAAPLLLALFVWKMASETLYPHYMPFEWIERGGSYGSILALWFAVRSKGYVMQNIERNGKDFVVKYG